MRTFEEYREHEGPIIAGRFLEHSIKRAELSKLPAPSSKPIKKPKLSVEDMFVFREAVSCFQKFTMERDGVLEIMMQDAFRRNDRRFFELLAKASDYADEPLQNKHGENVIATMRTASKIMLEENRFPTKAEVRAEVITSLGDAAFFEDDLQSWTKVFRDAHLSFLGKTTPKGAESRHGDRNVMPTSGEVG